MGLTKRSAYSNPEELLVNLKSRGGLIHANEKFFNLILVTEETFKKHQTSPDCFERTLDDILVNHNFDFPCKEHGADILSYALGYYLRMRMLQFTNQLNKKPEQKYIKIKKTSKFTDS